MFRTALTQMNDSEDGHAAPLFGSLISIVGLVLLGIGAANGTGWMAIAGGILGAVGAVATPILSHTKVEYDIYARLERLEGKK